MGIHATVRSFRDTLQEWKDFKHLTGRWPTLSIFTYVLFLLAMIAVTVCILSYSIRHSLTKFKGAVIVIVMILPLAILHAVVERTIRVLELRRARASLKRQG